MDVYFPCSVTGSPGAHTHPLVKELYVFLVLVQQPLERRLGVVDMAVELLVIAGTIGCCCLARSAECWLLVVAGNLYAGMPAESARQYGEFRLQIVAGNESARLSNGGGRGDGERGVCQVLRCAIRLQKDSEVADAPAAVMAEHSAEGTTVFVVKAAVEAVAEAFAEAIAEEDLSTMSKYPSQLPSRFYQR